MPQKYEFPDFMKDFMKEEAYQYAGELLEKQLREQIAKEIMDCTEIVENAKVLGPDAYLVAHRTRMACAVIAKGLK